MVSIPFIAGQWSLRDHGSHPPRRPTKVSIPFIAGQWSLRRADAKAEFSEPMFQSPSLRGSGRFARDSATGPGCCASFNPLHCGAVVASPADRVPGGAGSGVSIPFIAGQWSLRDTRPASAEVGQVFQSPSLRGSGRFERAAAADRPGRSVSIPFIAGQWSLLAEVRTEVHRTVEFQSPSLRGSGRFRGTRTCTA